MFDKEIEGFAELLSESALKACTGCNRLSDCRDVGNKGGLLCLDTLGSSKEQGVLDLFFVGNASADGVVNDCG